MKFFGERMAKCHGIRRCVIQMAFIMLHEGYESKMTACNVEIGIASADKIIWLREHKVKKKLWNSCTHSSVHLCCYSCNIFSSNKTISTIETNSDFSFGICFQISRHKIFLHVGFVKPIFCYSLSYFLKEFLA